MYGGFHLVISVALILLAALLAVKVSRLSESSIVRILSVSGWFLGAMELYKQLFLYYIVNNGVYDWWYFPFQLCSAPMYLCMLLPLLHRVTWHDRINSMLPPESPSDSHSHAHTGTCTGRIYNSALTFMTGFTFVGAVATFIYPEDILRPYITLTLHGFIWHGILLFISLTVVMSRIADLSVKGIARSVCLFLCMCLAAVCINIAAEPMMARAHSAGLIRNSYAAMFYLNPYHISPQPIVGTIQKSAGIPAGLALYVMVVIIAASSVDLIFRSLRHPDGNDLRESEG